MKILFLTILSTMLFVNIQTQGIQMPNFGVMPTIFIEKIDITNSNVDIIVNAANEQLAGGSGVCGAIFTAAGWDQLQKACNKFPAKNGVRCPVGQARMTDSFNLKKSGIKYIIHAVGPDCRIIKDHRQQDMLLISAYNKALELAHEAGAQSIAFPFISSAIYEFPKPRAARLALETVYQYCHDHPDAPFRSIYFALYSDEDVRTFLTTEIMAPKTHKSTKASSSSTVNNPSIFQKIMIYLKKYFA